MRNLFDLVSFEPIKEELDRLRQAEIDLPFDVTQDQLDSIRFQEKYWHTVVTFKFHLEEFVKTIDAQSVELARLKGRIAELEAAIDALTLSGADCYALVLELEEREKKYRIRIAELEADRDHWRNLVHDLEHNSIYLDSIAYYEGRIAELEAAIALSR